MEGRVMNEPILGFASRNQIREVLAGYTVDRIERYFFLGDFAPATGCPLATKGEERQLVERYYANIDFSSEATIQKFFVVLQEIVHDLEPAPRRQPWQHQSDLAEEHLARLIRFLGRDGIEIIDGQLRVSRGIVDSLVPRGLSNASEDTIRANVQRAKRRMSDGDYPAAITASYTLVEEFMKALLLKVGVEGKEDEGDIRNLYRDLRGPLSLDPAGENIESFLKKILGGLLSQVAGLYALANKASDRHARRYEPQRRHAQLAVNTAFTLCEFLLGAYEHQQTRREAVREE